MKLLEVRLLAARKLLISFLKSSWSFLRGLSNNSRASNVQGECDYGQIASAYIFIVERKLKLTILHSKNLV